MKRKSLFLVWLYTFITFCVYLLYWLFDSMKVINQLKEKTVFSIKKESTLMVGLFVIYLVLFSRHYLTIIKVTNQIIENGLFIITSVIALIWVIKLITLLYKIAVNIFELEKNLNIDNKCKPSLIFILFLLYFTVIPYLQKHLNSVIIKKIGIA